MEIQFYKYTLYIVWRNKFKIRYLFMKVHLYSVWYEALE